MAEGLIGEGRQFKVNIFMTAQQQQMQTGFYLRDVGVAGQTPGDVVDAVYPWVDTHFRTLLPSTLAITRIEALELTTKDYAQQELLNYLGTANPQEGPSFVSVLVQLRSAKRSRHRNGRMFWPGINKVAIDGSRVSDAFFTASAPVLADFTSRFLAGPLFADLKACVVAKARPATTKRPAIEASWIDVETLAMSRLLATLHRRKVGVGS